jgi:hypothetical protein
MFDLKEHTMQAYHTSRQPQLDASRYQIRIRQIERHEHSLALH